MQCLSKQIVLAYVIQVCGPSSTAVSSLNLPYVTQNSKDHHRGCSLRTSETKVMISSMQCIHG